MRGEGQAQQSPSVMRCHAISRGVIAVSSANCPKSVPDDQDQPNRRAGCDSFWSFGTVSLATAKARVVPDQSHQENHQSSSIKAAASAIKDPDPRYRHRLADQPQAAVKCDGVEAPDKPASRERWDGHVMHPRGIADRIFGD